jgi:hypothetical protein
VHVHAYCQLPCCVQVPLCRHGLDRHSSMDCSQLYPLCLTFYCDVPFTVTLIAGQEQLYRPAG